MSPWEVLRDEPDNYQVQLECPSRCVPVVEKILSFSPTMQKVGAGGGKGWIIGEGSILLTGQKEDILIVAQVLSDVIGGSL